MKQFSPKGLAFLGKWCMFVLLAFVFYLPSSQAQKIEKLEQGVNGKAGSPLNTVDWITGNANEQKAHFAECMTIPYHLELLELVPGTTYCVTLGYDTKRGDKHAIDFLTSYRADVVNEHSSIFGHVHDPDMMPELIDPLINTNLEGQTLTEQQIALPAPSFPMAGMTPIDPSTHYQDAVATPGEDYISLWNGTFTGTPCMQAEGDLDVSNAFAGVKVCFEVDPGESTVVLAWGGHIAASEVWGPGTSATAITGSPYHMFIAACGNDEYLGNVNSGCSPGELTAAEAGLNGCGNKEVQLQASAVVAAGECFVTGPNPICGDGMAEYTASLADGIGQIVEVDWAIIDESSGNVADFENDMNTTTDENAPYTAVVKGISGGTFTLQATITYCPEGTMNCNNPNNLVTVVCTREIAVEDPPTVTATASATDVCLSFNPPASITLTGSPLPTADANDGDLGTWMYAVGSDSPMQPMGDPDPLVDNGDGTATFDPVAAGAGTYIFVYQYTSPNGCTAEDEVTVNVYPPANLSIQGPSSVCDNDEPVMFQGLVDGVPTLGVMNMSPAPASGGFIGNAPSGKGTYTPSPQDAGVNYTITFTYIDSDNGNCINQTSIPFTVYMAPEVVISNPGDACQEVEGDLTFTATVDAVTVDENTVGTFSYSISPITGAFSDNGDGTATLTPANAAADEYTITFTYEDELGCEDSDAVIVNIYPTPMVSIGREGDPCDPNGDGTATFIGMVDMADIDGTADYSFSIDPAPAGTGTFIDNLDGTATFEPEAGDQAMYTVKFTYTSPEGEGSCMNMTTTTIDLTNCCEFFATCNLDNTIQMVEYCSYEEFLADNPFLTNIADVFTMVTDRPCGTLRMVARDIPNEGDVCPNGLNIVRQYFLWDDLPEGEIFPDGNGAFDGGEMFKLCGEQYMIIDKTAPVIECPAGDDLACDEDVPAPYTTVTGFVAAGGTVFEECSTLEDMTISVEEETTGTVCDGLTVTRTYTITDACGLKSKSCEEVFNIAPPDPADFDEPEFPESLSCADAFDFEAPSISYSNGQEGDCAISGIIEPDVTPSFDKCLGGTITVSYATQDKCGRPITAGPFVITVNAALDPTFGDPVLPELLSCADAFAFEDDDAGRILYSNGEEGPCMIAGSLAPQVVRDFDKCGGTIYVTYSGTTDCGITLSTETYEIDVEAAPEATFDEPTIPETLSCSDAADYVAMNLAPTIEFANDETGDCEIKGSIQPDVLPSFDKCKGGTITVTYNPTEDDCGRLVPAEPLVYTIQVDPAIAPDFTEKPDFLSVDCIDQVVKSSLAYSNAEDEDHAACLLEGSIESRIEEVFFDGCNGEFNEIWEGTDECGNPLYYTRKIYLDRAVSGSAQTVDELVCNNMTEVLLDYAVAGEPDAPDEYMIDADTDAENAGFTDVDWAALTGSPLVYNMVEGIEPGVYNFVFKVRSSKCTSCIDESPFTIEIVAPDYNLTCVGQVNVNLQGYDCQATLDWKNVLTGSFRCLNEEDYTVIVQDDYTANGGTVDGCGTYKFTVTGPNGFDCWGYVLAEDKQAPVCLDWEGFPSEIDGWETTDYGFQEFVCTDIDKLLLDGEASYKLDRYGNLIEGSISSAHAKWLFKKVTGYAKFEDNCGDITVTVTDEVDYGYDPNCDNVTITRTFTAVDACGSPLLTAQCSQDIIVTKPDLDDVYCPQDIELDCDEDIKLDANGNPHPDETGYPWLYQAFDPDFDPEDEEDYGYGDDDKYEHKAYLNPKFCNLGASYTDGERIEVCEGTYKIVRTWEILDWCREGYERVRECKQVIKVGDYEKPTVECVEVDYDNDGNADLRTYSTGPYDCTAAFHVPMPEVEDNCSSFEVLTEIVGFSTDGPVVATIAPGASRYVSGIPLGCHFIKYTVTDACGNKEVIFCPFQVEDQVEPIAVCDDDLNVSIGGQGLARVKASDIDEGSSDNCGPIRIEVRRRILDPENYDCLDMFDYDGDGEVIDDEVNLSVQFGDPEGDGNGEEFYYTPWAEYVDFTCCDMNENVRIELRVWDDRNGNGKPGDTAEVTYCGDYETTEVRDNYNVCWMDLLIEDKLPAYCVPPLPAAIDCDELPFDFDPTNAEQMAELFGEATGSDNCPGYTVEELDPLTDDLTDCGYGTFVRRFQVSDAKGQTSTNKCEQVVTIKEQHKYKIKFPKDAEANCGTPQVDTIETEELACDLLAVSVKDDFFSASGDECYKIFRTYSVINWCEYDGISDPVVVSRDEDCDGKPGDEDVWVIVMTMDDPDPCYDYYGGYQADFYSHVWYDRDNDPFNLEPKAGTKGENCDYETNPFGFWKEVYPITENEDDDTDDYPAGYYGDHCDDMASVGYWRYTQVIKVYDDVNPIVEFTAPDPFCSYSSDLENGCPAEVSIDFTIDENCTPDDLTVTIYLDAFADGVLDGDITDLLTGTYPNYNVTGTFPLGSHSIGVSVEDGCGNEVGINIPFEVVDCKAPSPICINGLAIELMPVIPAADVDGDGDDDSAAMAIWASDFIASPMTDCTGEVKYSINRAGEEVNEDQTGITLTCADDETTIVEIWAWDGLGNGDFCETYVLVQDNMVQCDGGTGSIAGVVTTEELATVEGVSIELSGNAFASMTTGNDGHYVFSALDEGFDYTITPQLDANPLNGVSTFDLVLMSKHILGLQNLDTPYKVLAADVNNDGRVTALDAIALRRLILNIDGKFANNTSWRFVDASYVFSNTGNPWANEFPEVINVNDLQGALQNADFVAIKVGDVSLDAKANALVGETRSKQGVFALNTDNVSMTTGNEYRIEMTATELAKLQGFQGTLTFDNSKVELVDLEYGAATAANFGMHLVDNGIITTSWDGKADNNEVLFTLVVRARTEAELSTVLNINSRVTVAEAYGSNEELMDLAINFGNGTVVSAGFELGQNAPNPFRTQTVINYNLPASTEVTFTITDAAGKLLQVLRTSGVQGNNVLTLERKDLPAGVLFYTLTTDDFTATKSMVVE